MKVFTNGCFDILHVGHLETLKFAWSISRNGLPRDGWMYESTAPKYKNGELIVGINSDESIKFIKGPHRPIIDQESRKKMLEAIRWVDRVIIFNELTPQKLIEELKPDVLVKGGDYRNQKIVGSDVAKHTILSFYDGNSSSNIIGRIIGLEKKREEASRNR